jgi:dimeric dUTPase (all-alpha-NTP-PPase superfamily)
MLMKITYVLVTLNRLEELQVALRRVSPYVDRTCVVDGGSEDGSIEWLGSDECKKMNVDFKVSKQVRLQYGDHTPRERNQYLEMAGTEGWILYTDTDEWLEEEACKNLYKLAEYAESVGANRIAFRAHDYWTHEDGQIYDHLSDYYNQSSMWRATSKQTYIGHTHAGIYTGEQPRVLQVGFEYLHVKNERTMWKNGSFLYWTSAKVADNVTEDPIWKQFHEVMRKYGYEDWHLFNKDMVKGNIPEEVKRWFIDHRDSENSDERSNFVHYFIFLHPSENILHISNRDKEWDYVEKCRIKRGLV